MSDSPKVGGSGTSIPIGHKFAQIALNGLTFDYSTPALVELGEGVIVTRDCPVAFDAFWSGTLGEESARLSRSGTFIVSQAKSGLPHLLDDENAYLRKVAGHWYLALMLSVPFSRHGESWAGTGANSGDGPTFRSVNKYSQVFGLVGCMPSRITEAHVGTAKAVFGGVEAVHLPGKFPRLWKMLYRYTDAIQSLDVAERIHSLVRSIEGILWPGKGSSREDFIKRLPFLAVGLDGTDIGTLYDVRSAVSHLHDPIGLLRGSSPRAKHEQLIRMGYSVEYLAREVLLRLLSNQAHWRFLQDNQTWEMMWGHSRDEFLQDWGEPIDASKAHDQFRPDIVSDEDLGL